MQNSLYLVDTSAWVLALRKTFFPSLKDRIDFLLKENAIITSEIIKLELLGGTKTERDFRHLKSRLDALDTVKLDTLLWERAYGLAFELRRKGMTIPYTDILVAACALKEGAVIVHFDVHFNLMAGHIGLAVESYVENKE